MHPICYQKWTSLVCTWIQTALKSNFTVNFHLIDDTWPPLLVVGRINYHHKLISYARALLVHHIMTCYGSFDNIINANERYCRQDINQSMKLIFEVMNLNWNFHHRRNARTVSLAYTRFFRQSSFVENGISVHFCVVYMMIDVDIVAIDLLFFRFFFCRI